MAGGGPVYYKQHRLFKKNWQRHFVFFVIGLKYDQLARDRNNTFRGKTALFGPETITQGRHSSS
ncbi:hypothetical protein QR98_0004790 [Sarcoptes scabiei]|uniref:Uncharacterized protein n=1 Tax=Sarcoptes scabiei TaxID=52283 RepID=A0A131ZTH2_SARSC|nr:hypothetical protein QR98_0004790 [Sarcoptes scabiei]